MKGVQLLVNRFLKELRGSERLLVGTSQQSAQALVFDRVSKDSSGGSRQYQHGNEP